MACEENYNKNTAKKCFLTDSVLKHWYPILGCHKSSHFNHLGVQPIIEMTYKGAARQKLEKYFLKQKMNSRMNHNFC